MPRNHDGAGEARSRIEIVADRIEYLDAPKTKDTGEAPVDDAA